MASEVGRPPTSCLDHVDDQILRKDSTDRGLKHCSIFIGIDIDTGRFGVGRNLVGDRWQDGVGSLGKIHGLNREMSYLDA